MCRTHSANSEQESCFQLLLFVWFLRCLCRLAICSVDSLSFTSQLTPPKSKLFSHWLISAGFLRSKCELVLFCVTALIFVHPLRKWLGQTDYVCSQSLHCRYWSTNRACQLLWSPRPAQSRTSWDPDPSPPSIGRTCLARVPLSRSLRRWPLRYDFRWDRCLSFGPLDLCLPYLNLRLSSAVYSILQLVPCFHLRNRSRMTLRSDTGSLSLLDRFIQSILLSSKPIAIYYLINPWILWVWLALSLQLLWWTSAIPLTFW